MATWKSAAYDGRYLQLDISESVNVVGNSSTLSWTLTSTGGASTYYTIDTTTVTINGTTVYSKSRTYWDDRVFPAKKGSVSGTITVAHDSNGSKTIAVGFSTRVYIYGSQEYGGSMTLTTIDRSAPTVTFSTSNVTANGFKISATSSATADIWQYSTNGGSSWTQFSTTASTSASVTLSSLSPNTSYTVRVRARRQYNHVYGTSGSSTVKTLGGAVVNSVNTVTADNATVSITINVTVYEASRSISENCTWGQRKRFADGKVTVPFKRFLGYDMGPDHNLVVNPEQAKLVKRIYGMFLQGQSPFQIARTLTEEGIPSPGGKDHWNPSNIKSILTNEKYKGDALLQKSFTVDFLTKKKKTNEGEIPQYYVKDNHEAIIDPETFEMVQTLMTTRTKGRNRKSSVSIFSSKVKCGDCGSWYGPKVWHSNDAYRKVIWQCNHKFDGQKCATPTLTEDEIKELFLRAANQVIDQKEQFIAIYDQVLSRSLDTTALESELSDLEAEINIAAELIEECIKENAHVALDQDEYQKRYDALVARFDKAKARHTEVTDLIAERMARKHQIEAYLKNLRSRESLTEFRETDWLAMVNYITVHSKKDIWVTFKDGNEIKA